MRAGEVGAAVRLVVRGAEEVARRTRERALQSVIDSAVDRVPGARRSGFRGRTLSPWSCLRCGPRLGGELRRNGHYRRRPRLQRCTWHLKHNAAEWIREPYPIGEDEAQRQGLMAAVHAIVDAPSHTERHHSLEAIRPGFGWLGPRPHPAPKRRPSRPHQ